MDAYLVWTLTILFSLVGLAGVVIPLLPGTTLILFGMVVHKLLRPEDVSWVMIGWITGVWLLSVIIDFAGVLLGTRLFGGGKWGMVGAGGGALVGMFFSLPMLVLGTVLGAVAAEKLIAQKSHRASLLAGAGAAVGFLISTVGRLLCAVIMIGLFLLAAWHASEGTAREVEATVQAVTETHTARACPAEPRFKYASKWEATTRTNGRPISVT